MSKDKVVSIFTLPSYSIGGIENNIYKMHNFIDNFTEISLFDVTDKVKEKKPNTKIINSGIDVYTLFKNKLKAPLVLLKTKKMLNKELKKIRPDVLLITHPYMFAFIKKKYLKNTKVVVRQQIDPSWWFDNLVNTFKSRISGVKGKIKFIDDMVCFSKYDEIKFKEITNHKWNYHINTTVDMNKEIQSNVKNNKCVYLGRLADVKNIIQTMKLFEDNKIELDIYGGGPLKDDVIKISSQMKYVNFMGRMNSEDVIKGLSNYKFLVLNSKTEGLPNVVLEGFKAGTPAIINNNFACHELLAENGKCIILEDLQSQIKDFDYNNAIKEIKMFNTEYSEDKFIANWRRILCK